MLWIALRVPPTLSSSMRYLAALSLALLSASPCWSQGAPVNDNIANATLLSANQTLNRMTGNVTGVTPDGLTITLPGSTVPTAGYLLPSVWFKWTAPMDGSVAIQGAGTNFTIWGTTLLSPPVAGVYAAVGTDASSTTYSSGVSITAYNYDVEAGQTYLCALETGAVSIPNTYVYVHRFIQESISDTFSSRSQLGGVDFTVSGNNAAFDQEEGEPDHAQNPITSSDKSAWMTWRSPNARKSVTIEVKSKAFEPLVVIYTGDTLTGLTRVARGNLAVNRDGNTSTVTFVAEDDVDYQIAVDGSKARAGAFSLSLKATTVRPGFLVHPTATIVEQGQTAVFSATASYTGATVSYQWERQIGGKGAWEPLTADDTTFTGVQTSELTIVTTLDMNKDRYRVLATDSVGTSPSRSALLTVTEFPAVETEVLGTVNTDIAQGIVPLPSNDGVYFAIGLPRGLTLDPETGVISGVVDARPGTYRVLYGSTNGKVRNPEQFVLQIVVAPFSLPLTGSFEALLNDADESLPAGKLTLKVAQNGRYTGSYYSLAESRTYKFRGTLALDQTARTAGTPIDQPVVVSRGTALAPFNLEFSLAEPSPDTPDSYTVFSAALSDSDDGLIAQANDGAAVKVFTATSPAAWVGNYTLRLTQPTSLGDDAELSLPLGSGYATGSVEAKSSALRLRGRLADNTPFTANLASSPTATYRLAQRVHAVGGSLAGRIVLTEEATANPTLVNYHVGEEADAKLFWVKPQRPKDKLYPEGFGSSPVALTLLMQPWRDPADNFPAALGLAAIGDMKVNIVAVVPQDSNDALTSQANNYSLPIDVQLGATGKFTFVTPATNPTKFSININPASGMFSGSYQLAEPIIPPATRSTLVRKVRFSGVLLQRGSTFFGDVIGDGFAIVPPVEAEEATTSALIDFRAGEPDSPFEIEPDR